MSAFNRFEKELCFDRSRPKSRGVPATVTPYTKSLSLRGTTDERVEAALDELLAGMKW